MSLLNDAMEVFTILNRVIVNDGYGGTKVTWSDGVEIIGAMVFDTSNEAKIAMSLGVKSNYTFTTNKNVNLQYHDVIRRKSDSKIFRVTSDGDDKFTPISATLNMRQVTCEEWELS